MHNLKNQIKKILSSKPHQDEWKAEENDRKWTLAVVLQNFYNLMRKKVTLTMIL